jgi:hypothetical protein
MKIRDILRKLSTPRVRKRLKIGLSLWGFAIVMGLIVKTVYDIGYFKAQSVIDDKNSAIPNAQLKLTIESAQRIVSGALKEELNNPKTIVVRIVDNNPKLAAIIININNQQRVAWIIEMRLFFDGDLLNDNGYNLTDAIANQYNIK